MNTFHRQQHDFPFANPGEGRKPDEASGAPEEPGPGGSAMPDESSGAPPAPKPTPDAARTPEPTSGAGARRAAPTTAGPGPVVAYLDVILLVLGAPIMLLIGVSATGYLIGAGAWIVLRAVGVVVDRWFAALDSRTQISARLGYMLGRLFLLALAVIMARQRGGKDAGLAALVVIVFAFTIQLGISAVNRPSSR